MARIFGHKWTSINESDDGTWLAGLSDVTPDQVAHGLSVLVTNHQEWPPSLPEFRDLCLDHKDEPSDIWQHKVGAHGSLKPYKALPALKASDSVVSTEREKLIGLGVLKKPV